MFPAVGSDGEGLVARYPFGGICLFTFLPVLFRDSFLHIPDRMRISAGGLFLLVSRPRAGPAEAET